MLDGAVGMVGGVACCVAGGGEGVAVSAGFFRSVMGDGAGTAFCGEEGLFVSVWSRLARCLPDGPWGAFGGGVAVAGAVAAVEEPSAAFLAAFSASALALRCALPGLKPKSR